MAQQSIVYKIATAIQIVAAIAAAVFMAISYFSQQAHQAEQSMLSGGVVIFLFVIIAASSAIKSFSQQ